MRKSSNHSRFNLGTRLVQGLALALTILMCLTGEVRAQTDHSVQSRNSGRLQKLVLLPDQPEAPDFTLQDTKGVTHTLSAYRGQVVIVNFWSVYCAPCRKEMPHMQRAWETLRHQGYRLLAVNWADSEDAIGKFVDSLPPMDFPLLVGGDKAMMQQWGVGGLPTTFILNRDGHVTHRAVGELKWDDPAILAQLLTLKGPAASKMQ